MFVLVFVDENTNKTVSFVWIILFTSF
jgi:hypothetical protein